MKWVRLKRYCEATGETADSLKHLRASGKLAEGVHWRKDQLGRIWVNTEAMQRWVEGDRLMA